MSAQSAENNPIDIRRNVRSTREKELENALHAVYDGLMLTLASARIVGEPDETKIRTAIRQAQKSYHSVIRA